MATQPTNLPVPSESPRDLKFNAGKIDEFVTSRELKYIDRFGGEHYTIEGMRQIAQLAISAFGYITMDSFEDGNTLTLPNQVLRLKATGEYYRWDGTFPKVVPAGSTPESTGGIGLGAWLSVGQATLSYLIPNVRSLWGEHLEKLGMVLVGGSFREGASVTAPNQAVWDDLSGLAYARVAGDSVTVAAGTVPDSAWTSNIGARIKAWLPNTSPNTDVSARLQALLTSGRGEIKIPDGRYAVNTGLVTNFSDSSFPSLGAGSPRYDFVGSSKSNTIFINTNSTFLSHTGGVAGTLVQGAITQMNH
ncbi:hypothetical protein LZ642_18140, partial [Hafnia paralvei]|nr:hypothetical protein [Hafnia paralvei]